MFAVKFITKCFEVLLRQ